MLPNMILRKARREHEISLAQMGEWLGATSQRVGQWESGDPIPAERASAWRKDDGLPEWIREMARDIEISSLREQNAAINARIDQLDRNIA
jgi:predicted transcriptional regulator